jgi:hypothetical protein
MQRELDAVRSGDPSIRIRYLPQVLHRNSDRMTQVIQDEINGVEGDVEQIVLGYGLCSNGVVGISAPRHWLIVPRVHDCIAVFLGSQDAYQRAFDERPGTYYLTPGWIDEEKDPIGVLENEYVALFGREEAESALHEEFKYYSHIAVINDGGAGMDRLRARARENARLLNKEYIELPGSDSYFHSILFGPYEADRFLVLPPGEKVRQKPFFGFS